MADFCREKADLPPMPSHLLDAAAHPCDGVVGDHFRHIGAIGHAQFVGGDPAIAIRWRANRQPTAWVVTVNVHFRSHEQSIGDIVVGTGSATNIGFARDDQGGIRERLAERGVRGAK